MTDKQPQYELTGTGIELTEDQLLALVNLFNEPGWRVFMQIKSVQSTTAVEAGMGLATPEDQRTMNRAIYHGILADMQLPQDVRETLQIVAQQKALNKRT